MCKTLSFSLDSDHNLVICNKCFLCMSRWGRSACQGPEGDVRSSGLPRTAWAEGGHGSAGASWPDRQSRGEGNGLQPFQPAEMYNFPQTGDTTSPRDRHCHRLQQVRNDTSETWHPFFVAEWMEMCNRNEMWSLLYSKLWNNGNAEGNGKDHKSVTVSFFI